MQQAGSQILRPRILLLTPQLPFPPEQGTSLRNYNILLGLQERYRVTLLSFIHNSPSGEALDRLSAYADVVTVPVSNRSMGTRLWRMIADRRPDMAHRLQNVQFESTLAKTLRQGSEAIKGSNSGFEVVQVEGIELAFAIEIIRANSPRSKIIFDDHNAEYELQRRNYLADRLNVSRLPAAIYSRVQAGRLRAYEQQVCDLSDHVVAVSEEDRRLLQKLGLKKPVTVIPNSIDVQDYETSELDSVKFDLVFVGKMDYRPNVDAVLWFANNVWPIIQLKRPETTWAIVGKNPHARLGPLKEQTGITVTGRVERVQPYLQGSKVCLMPFRVGSGTRLKLIEAMASRRAIVSTTVGAEGFELQSGNELILADLPGDFASSVLALLDNGEYRRQLGEAARKFAEQYDWRQVAPRFYQIIDNLLQYN